MGQGPVVAAVDRGDDATGEPGGAVLGTAVMAPNRLGRGSPVATASCMHRFPP